MKVQATVVLTFQAKSLEQAGAVLDDVLARARAREDVDVGRVEVVSPPGDRVVTLPPLLAATGHAPRVPPPGLPGMGGDDDHPRSAVGAAGESAAVGGGRYLEAPRAVDRDECRVADSAS
jgi:hypothetical protein